MTEDMTPLEREWKLHIILGDIRYLVREYVRLYVLAHPEPDARGKAHLDAVNVANWAPDFNDQHSIWDWYRDEFRQIDERLREGEE